MASKVQIQKARQGYVEEGPKCSTCANYTSETVKMTSRWGGTWTEEKNKRCSIGGFVVKKQAYCKSYAPKGEQ